MLQELEIKALKGESKTSRLKIKPDSKREPLKKPEWIRIRHTNSNKVNELKKTLSKSISLNGALCFDFAHFHRYAPPPNSTKSTDATVSAASVYIR